MHENSLPIINKDQCTLCGVCVTFCPEKVLTMKAQGPKFQNPAGCTYCTDCEDICVTGAIRAPLTVRWAPGSST